MSDVRAGSIQQHHDDKLGSSKSHAGMDGRHSGSAGTFVSSISAVFKGGHGSKHGRSQAWTPLGGASAARSSTSSSTCSQWFGCSSCCSSSDDRTESPSKHTLDRVFFRRLWQITKLFFPSIRAQPSMWLCLLLGLALGLQVVYYLIGMIPSRYYSILQRKDESAFTAQTIYCFVLVVAVAVMNSASGFVQAQLYLQYRQRLTLFLQQLYFSNTTCYRTNVLDSRVDNADQRIAQDVDKFSTSLSKIQAKIIILPLTILYYTYQSANAMGWVGPVSVFGFFIVGTVSNKFLISFIVPQVVKQERLEGDFRYAHAHVRSNAEAVAFYHSERREEENVTRRFAELIRTQERLIFRNVFLDISIGLFDYAGSILSYLVIAVPIFAGRYDDQLSNISTVISQSAFVSIYLISCFSTLIDLSTEFSNLAGFTHRLGEMMEVFMDTSLLRPVAQDNDDEDPDERAASTQKTIVFDHVSFETPKDHVQIVKDLNLVIEEQMNIQVMGASGCGKTSLLRTLNDLWPLSSGTITKPRHVGRNGLFYLPQVPFVSDGTLRDLLKYPNRDDLTHDNLVELSRVFCPGAVPSSSASSAAISLAHSGSLVRVDPALEFEDKVLTSILAEVKLGFVVSRCGGYDTWHDWTFYDSFSPGEKQRLAFVRLFLQRPQFAVLDESTSAISGDLESELYSLCRALNITTVSIAHRRSLLKFHDYLLMFNGEAGWSLKPIDAAMRQRV
ncbi:ATP-binding cassette sub-family D member 4 [Capsaspora owczarzaki ATCC 30864]|uniref:ATP-binding cassette sub-family D member 4 n=1 Tax=Capsaspora owczarzaki (strain ATCC 30864) TaxID=595528 RepID=UPI00035247C8|nr:ATP-binding cassette sub-family D member 4 [Capsaspora owczarzaki ATCC 30864]|eukprot:XP_004348078.2 ATP-binding cassette sub-family D member 4 [Capsaspora owczarzaki ATCC 30864]